MFDLCLVDKVTLSREMIDGKRYYCLPNGNKFRSVTTILGEKLDKSGLMEWRKRVGEEEAVKISVQAARRGTAVHNLCEKYVLNEEIDYKKEMPSNVVTFKSIQKVLDDKVGKVLGVELPLYSVGLKCAGTTDLIAEYDGIVSIIDYKTSKKVKEESWIESYFLQCTVYAMMFSWIYKINCPQIVLIIAVDDEDYPQVIVKQTKDYVERVLEVFGAD